MDGKTFVELLEPQTRSKNNEMGLKGIQGTSFDGMKIEHYYDRLITQAVTSITGSLNTLIHDKEITHADLFENEGAEVQKFTKREARDFYLSKSVMPEMDDEQLARAAQSANQA